jgi:uncharacterized membrane protein
MVPVNILHIFGIIASSIYILFIPGFILSLALFKTHTIDLLERIALSFALSIAVVPLIAFYLNLLGLRINRMNIFLEVLGIIIISSIFAYRRNKHVF